MRAFIRGIGRYFFRFLLFYCICFVFPFPLALVGLPFQLVDAKDQPDWMKSANQHLGEAYLWIYNQEKEACVWVGNKVLDKEVKMQPTGSGDTMRAYVGCLCAAAIAAACALVWSAVVLLVRRWKHGWRADDFLHGVVRVLVRFFLAEMLFGYGFAKVFPLQFPPPSAVKLAEQLGDMSPMGLLWTFMGFSAPYQMFTGAVEVLGGLLLLTRRTTLLGALVSMAAMTQVFVLNMCFDVPVKLYSLHYLVLALFLAAPDLRWLVRVLVLGKSAEARPFPPLLRRIWLDRCALALRTLVIAVMLYGHIQPAYRMWTDAYGGPPAPVLGRWEVVSMSVDQKELSPGDPLPWKSLDFMNKMLMRLLGPTPPAVTYRVAWNPAEKSLVLTKAMQPSLSGTFSYDFPEPEVLKLQGSIDGKAIVATLKPAPEKEYELTHCGFHWIQELPYNR